MKKVLCILLLPVMLLGCSAQETFETVTDEYVQPALATMQQVALQLPEDAASAVMQNEENETIYFCDDYTITMQIREAGDLNQTLYAATGYPKDQLSIIETASGDAKRYDCVWAAAGEGEEQVGRAAVLDDGNYHYILTCMAGASDAHRLQEQWQALFTSFCLTELGSDLYTGS